MAFGTVNFRVFDEGVANAFGAVLVPYVMDGQTRQAYAVNIPGIEVPPNKLGGLIPIYWDKPEDPYQRHFLPSFLIRRTELRVAFDRSPWFHVMQKSAGRTVVLPDGRQGPSHREVKRGPVPMDMPYDVQIYARLRRDADRMLLHLLKACPPPWFPLAVIDSEGDTRKYDAGDFNISDLSELADVSNRTLGYTVSFTVRGEIDLYDENVVPTMQAVDLTMYNFQQ